MSASIRLLARVSSSARSPSLISKLRSEILNLSSQSHVPVLGRRSFCISRFPVALSCLGSMMPLHSAIASARLKSVLSVESQSWGLIPQEVLESMAAGAFHEQKAIQCLYDMEWSLPLLDASQISMFVREDMNCSAPWFGFKN